MADFAARLARWRVTLGFVTAAAVLVFARPTPSSLAWGFATAAIGECLRIWAAGHLEKSREVTDSGPYRWTRHPLYVGSTIIAVGVVVASRSLLVAALAALYMGATIPAAIRTEEAFLRRTFGETYDRYARTPRNAAEAFRQTAAESSPRRFSLYRARRNREYRAVLGLIAGFGLLALKLLRPI